MFRPVGSLPPGVYWRRRFVMLCSVVALLILLGVTVSVLLGGGSPRTGATAAAANTRPPSTGAAPTAPNAGGTGQHSARPSPTHTQTLQPRTTSPDATPTGGGHTSGGPSGQTSGSTDPTSTSASPSTSSVMPKRCDTAQLKLSAATDKARYGINDNPTLSLLVTNPGPSPCVQDLADPQIVLTVYNGEARVWGSHDCKIEPGTDDKTLMPGSSVRVIIEWTGLSSSPNCAGTRQRVGAGSYTLYATLAGQQAKSTQFTIG